MGYSNNVSAFSSFDAHELVDSSVKPLAHAQSSQRLEVKPSIRQVLAETLTLWQRHILHVYSRYIRQSIRYLLLGISKVASFRTVSTYRIV